MEAICYFCYSDSMQFLGRDPELKVEVFHCESCGLTESPREGSLYLKNFYTSSYRDQREESFTDKYIDFMENRGETQYKF